MRWLAAARQPETRERRIELALDRLEATRLRDRS
ncbi:MAG: YdeI/OmpD-associated family protein [Gemmatimonadales bacterium]